MSKRVFLHVGVPKTGTSYVQRVMQANKARLASEASLLFPGNRWRHQVLAVRDLRGMKPRRPSRGAWARLVAEVDAWHGDSLVSMEWLCASTPEQIRKAVEDLAPAQVEVVFTVRDLGRTLPAAWQEFVQNRRDWTWEQFLSAVTQRQTSERSPGRIFWSQQDVPVLIDRWAQAVGREHVHVVTLPPRGTAPEVFWSRLASVLSLPDDFTVGGRPSANESLGLESVEMLRRLNPLLREAGMTKQGYNRLLKAGLAKQVLSGRKEGESTVTLPGSYRGAVQQLAREQVEGIRACGVEVVGDLDELIVPETPDHGAAAAVAASGDVSEERVLDAALTGLALVARRCEGTEEDKELLKQENERLRRRLAHVDQRLQDERRRATRLEEELRRIEASPLVAAARIRSRGLRQHAQAARAGAARGGSAPAAL